MMKHVQNLSFLQIVVKTHFENSEVVIFIIITERFTNLKVKPSNRSMSKHVQNLSFLQIFVKFHFKNFEVVIFSQRKHLCEKTFASAGFRSRMICNRFAIKKR